MHLVVGTHALAGGRRSSSSELGLVIIDEQHRFGVLQRATLRAKGLHPDVLVMTATPIPRTLALTAYGDLDVSMIRELPPGRQPITTIAKPESRRDEVYEFVRERARRRAPGLRRSIRWSRSRRRSTCKRRTEMADHLRRRSSRPIGSACCTAG